MPPRPSIPDAAQLFQRSAQPVIAQEGLRHVGGSSSSLLQLDVSQPRIRRAAAAAPAAAQDLPLTIKKSGRVIYGTILGEEPTIGGVKLSHSPPPTLSLPESGTSYIVATVTGTLAQTTLADRTFTHGMNVTAVELALAGTAPGAPGLLSSSGSYSFSLGVCTDGTLYNNGYGPITGGVDDILDGSGSAYLNLSFPA